MKRFIDLTKGDKVYMYNRLAKEMICFTVVSSEMDKFDMTKIILDYDGDESTIWIKKEQRYKTSARLDDNIIFSTQPIQ